MFLEILPPVKKLATAMRNLNNAIQNHDNGIRNLNANDNKQRHDIEKLQKQAASLTYLNRWRMKPSRFLSAAEIEALAIKWLPRFGCHWEPAEGVQVLNYMAHNLCVIEDVCIGRIGGTLSSIILRVLAARNVSSPNLEILEIGTMFGCGVAAIYNCCVGFFDKIHLTVIDPLDGYNKQPLDCITRLPVVPEIFNRNMERLGIPNSDYTIIKGMSQDGKSISEAKKRTYNLLIVDGDHTYNRVRSDYLNYRPFVVPGGYIVFDDYATPSPEDATQVDVMKFVDEEVRGSLDLLLVGADIADRTAIFKVLK